MFKSHHTRGFFICAFVTAFVLTGYAFHFFDSLENKSIDFRFKQRGARAVDPRIVVVVIDEPSIQEVGRWPWPRKIHGQLLERLYAAGASVVAIDSLFTEPDLVDPASDQALVEASLRAPIMVSAFFFKGDIRDRVFGVDPAFPVLGLHETSYIGFVNNEPDADGICRRISLYAIYNEAVYPSFAVAALALSQQKSIEELLPELPIVLSQNPELAENSLMINYAKASAQGDEAYPTYSYKEVLSGKIDSSRFKDKIVFVGATAAALSDIKATPYAAEMPGVMIHANVVDNLLAKNFMRDVPSYWNALAIVVVGLLFAIILPRLSTWSKLVFFLFMVFGGIGVSQWLFNNRQLILVWVAPMVVSFGSYGGVLFYQVVIEEREKRKIKGSFRQYLSPKIIDILTKDPSKLKLGGEEREVTIFFLDIAGFTTMSEALKPTQLVEVMNQCLTTFTDIILKHDGLINKYIGDCIMAFWNAPADQPRHASMACLAALECIEALPAINRIFKEQGLPSIDCRVGINTGIAVVGNMGSKERFDYTVLGDPVNLASRLEGANKQYNTHIMVSDSTYEKAKQDIEARDLDLIRVKGKKEPRRVYELLARQSQLHEDVVLGREKYHAAIAMYRQGDFQGAMSFFEQTLDYMPNDPVTKIYINRTQSFLEYPPPPGWDGVFDMKTK